MLHFLHISPQETLLLILVITLMIFFWMQNPVFLFVEFPPKIIPYDIMDWT
jgi:hypothetical protein